MKFQLLSILGVLVFITNVVAYKPVAIVHGIMFHPDDHMEKLRDMILEAKPDTEVNILYMLYYQESFLPMWYQVSKFQAEVQKMVDKYPDGINLIGYSQGGLIARGVLETTPNHTVVSFVSLSSPQNGFHGQWYVPNSTFWVGNEEHASDSVAGFWKDPKDLDKYKREKRYLAALNNEFKHPLNTQFKEAMCKLKNLTLIGGPNDGVVVPWQSALFDFDDAKGEISDMKEQSVYKNDNFCLKTLDKKGAIKRYTVPGVKHPDWHNTPFVVKDYILPHLV